MTKPSKTRVVKYDFEGAIDVEAASRILERALQSDVITQYVAKHYADSDIVWFEGPPGPELRAVRSAITKLVTSSTRRNHG